MKRAISDIRAVLRSVRCARLASRQNRSDGIDPEWRGESSDYLRGVEDALAFVLGKRVAHFLSVLTRAEEEPKS